MDSRTIVDRSKKLHIYLFFDYEIETSDKDKFISFLTKDLKILDIGYAGFNTKKNLNKYLKNKIFSSEKKVKIKRYEIKNGEIIDIIKKTIVLCQKIYEIKNLNIFVFPSFDLFVKKKMAGVTGFTPWKNTILLFINPAKAWKKSLKKTVAHEFCHVATIKNHRWTTLLDSIIFEGLAENFVQCVIKNKLSPWSKTLNLKQSKKYFKKLKENLDSKDINIYKSIFFKGEEYPLWAGYAIGYNIVKRFLDNHPKYSWSKIIKLRPQDILDKSNFM